MHAFNYNLPINPDCARQNHTVPSKCVQRVGVLYRMPPNVANILYTQGM